jgi:hypothetical protein
MVRMGRRKSLNSMTRANEKLGQLVRPRHRWVDNIKKKHVKEIRRDDVDWIFLVQYKESWPYILNSVKSWLHKEQEIS